MPRYMLEGPLKNLHNLLFYVHTLYINYFMNVFLILVPQSQVNSYVLYTIKEKKRTKTYIDVGFDNHSHALTMAILNYVYSTSC